MHRTILGKEVYIPMDPYKTSRRIEVRILEQYLDVKPGDRLCDIGCGTGYWTENIAKGCFAVGLDRLWKDTSIAIRKHAGNAGYILGNAEKLPFADAAFNKIFGVCSIEHIPDDASAFSEFHRCMTPGGVLAMTVDSLNYSAITEHVRSAHAKRYNVEHLYTVESVTQRLAQAGFTVTDSKYLICSSVSHWMNRLAERRRRFQYLVFPVSYPLTLLADAMWGRKNEGWKLAVRAVRN